MAHPMPVGMLGRLKDQRVAVNERLTLARKLWATESEVGPNKQQIITDAVVGLLVNNKKRNDLTDAERTDTWGTLSYILKSVSNASKNGSTLAVRPLLAQVLVDTLEAFACRTEITKQSHDDTLAYVLECCSAILQSSTLSYVLTTRFEILVSLASVVCQLCVSLPQTLNSSLDLSLLLSQATSHLQQTSHRCQLSPSQVLHTVIDRLLQPAVLLAYKVQLQSDSERLTASAQSLVEFVLKTVFHEGHQKLYKTYLETVTKQLMNQQTDNDVKDEISQSVMDKAKQQDSSQLPWLISNLFSNLFASFKPVKEKKTDCKLVVASKDAVLHFLPTFLKHAVHAWRKSPQQTFQLLIHVNSYLGFPVDSAEGKTEDSYVETVVALLTVVHDSGVYNVAADRARGGAQLKYFRRMLQVLLKAEISSSLCRCLSVLLHLNHLILEPTMKQVLHFCCSQLTQLPVEIRSSVDVFLSSLVSTYSQLHQVPKWFGFVLDLNAVAPQQLPSVLSLPAFRQQLHEVIQQLPQTTAVDVWSRLSSEVTSAYKAVTDGNDDADVREKLWSIVLLYHEFISYVRLYDSSVTARIVDKIQSLQADLEQNIITPALKNIQQKGKTDILLTRSCLLLAVCLGNVKLMLALYRTSGASHQEFRITSADLPFSLQLHELLGKKKSLASDAVVRSLVDSLMVQRVQALEQEESTGVADRPELQSYFTFSEGMQEEALKVEWDGCVSHVDDERYQLSKLHQITHKSASLLPMMLEKNGADLPKLIVRVFAESDQKETPGRHTAYSVARHLLHETEAGNSQEFYQQLVCCIWQHFAQGCTVSPKKKKKTGSETLVPVLQSLGEEGISWTDLSHKVVKRVSGAVNAVLTDEKVLPVTLTKQQKLLQLFHHLPLAYLPSGSQLQCILGLLTLLLHHDRSTFSKTRVPTLSPEQHPHSQHPSSCASVKKIRAQIKPDDLHGGDKIKSSLGQEVDLTERGEEVLKREDLGTERSTGDDLCCLLMEQLDASAGTSVFRVVKPHLLLNHLEKLCSQCQVEEGSPLGQLLKKTVATVMGDFQSVLELEGFFSELKKRLQEVSDKLQTRHAGDLNLASYRMLFTVTQYLLQETHWHLKRDFYRKDVQTASRSYFSSISAAIDTIVGTLQQLHSKGTKFALPCHLMQCLEAVTVQRSVDAASHDKDSILDRSHLDGVEFVLQHVINTLSQGTATAASGNISFVSAVYRHQTQLATLLTADRTRAVWNTLCSLLLKTHTAVTRDDFANKNNSSNNDDGGDDSLPQTEMSAETEKSVVKRKRKQDREDKSSVSPAKKVRVAGPDQEDSRRMLVSVGEGCLEAEGMEECVRDTLAVVATACDISLFADLMEGLVRDVSVDNLANPAMIQEAVAVWQKVIGCSRLTNEQRAVLERLSVKYLLQCVAVMTEISCFFQGLAQGVGVPILHSLAQMLTLERFLSFKGTVQCLMCCSLQSLRHHANRDFLSSFNAVYDVLHAVLVHHPNTSVKVIHNVMAVASSLLKECIRNGDQDRLLAQPAYVDPMVKCANLVSRLLALLANHRTELHRVAVGIVSDYANGVKAVTLLPVVKKALLPGVYAFLDLCDKHATSHLRVMLPAGVREVFHLLHNDFLKYYKYTGKV